MNIDLNRSIRINVTYLEYNYVGRHTRNSLFSTTSSENFRYKVFPVGECLNDTIKDSSWRITCLTIKPKNMINIKCTLGFCDEFNDYIITDEEQYDGPNDSIIHYSVYTYQGKCATHGIIPNGVSVCKT